MVSRVVLVALVSLLSLCMSACQSPPPDIVKSPNDSRSYRLHTLPNGLSVLLISDPDAVKSSVALSVAAGSFDEPAEFPGLAHLLEHMLFLGSEKYPQAGDYAEFVNQSGGNLNAYTDNQQTNFMVSVDDASFELALDRFSRFFWQATLDPAYTDKERHAVDAEWRMKRSDDWVILARLDERTLAPAHPAHRFSWGNLQTLQDSKNATLHQALMDFYHTYYRANQMQAVLISPRSLDQQIALAERFFTPIPSGQNRQTAPLPPALDANTGAKWLTYQPQADMRQLRISFVINNNQAEYRFKPNHYITYLLNSEMPGTLAATLREQGLVEALYADVEPAQYGNAGNFSIFADLTLAGAQQPERIVGAVFNYLQLISQQGIQQAYADELRQSLQNNFRFLTESDNAQLAMHLAAQLHNYPARDVLVFPYQFAQFEPQRIRAVLAQMTLDNARITLISPQAQANQHFEHFPGLYSQHKITPSQLQSWQQQARSLTLTLPAFNTLMPGEFALHQPLSDTPQILQNDSAGSMVLMQNGTFKEPKGHILIELNSDITKQSPTSYVVASLLSRALGRQTTDLYDEAIAAGMSLSVGINNGLNIELAGFSERQPELLDRLLTRLHSMRFEPAHLANHKAALLEEWQNEDKAMLIDQLMPTLSRLISRDEFDRDALRNALNGISVDDLRRQLTELLSSYHLRVLMFGNYSLDIANSIHTRLSAANANNPRYISPMLSLPPGTTLSWQQDAELNDTAWLDAYTQPYSVEQDATSRLLSQLINGAMFRVLRTEQQLGYSLGYFTLPIQQQLFSGFYLQSANSDLHTTFAAVERFKADFRAQLQALSSDELNTIRASLLANLQTPPTSTTVALSRVLRDWQQNHLQFDQRQHLINAVQSVTLQDILALYDSYAGHTRYLIQLRGANFQQTPFIQLPDAKQITSLNEAH